MEEERPAHDDRSDQTVQDEGAREVGAEPVAVNVIVVVELEAGSYDTLLTAA